MLCCAVLCCAVLRSYGPNEWKDDIKRVLRMAGMEDRRVVFLLNDTQIKHESFLEDVDALLNSGEVREEPSCVVVPL